MKLGPLIRCRSAFKGLFLDKVGHPTPNAEIVLARLRRYCHANSSSIVVSPITRTVDPLATAVAEGRRQVWNLIQGYLNLDESTLAKLREGPEEMETYG